MAVRYSIMQRPKPGDASRLKSFMPLPKAMAKSVCVS